MMWIALFVVCVASIIDWFISENPGKYNPLVWFAVIVMMLFDVDGCRTK